MDDDPDDILVSAYCMSVWDQNKCVEFAEKFCSRRDAWYSEPMCADLFDYGWADAVTRLKEEKNRIQSICTLICGDDSGDT